MKVAVCKLGKKNKKKKVSHVGFGMIRPIFFEFTQIEEELN